MDKLEDKYIDLLLKRCVNFNHSKSLFINYQIKTTFIDKIVKKAKEMGVKDIYLNYEDISKKHKILKAISLEEIDKHPFFNHQIWDTYALKNASFLILKTELPNLMEDVAPEKLARASYIERATKPLFKKLQGTFKVPWCIAVLPNPLWAKKIFPTVTEEEAYAKLKNSVYSACMINTENPIESWNKFLNKQQEMVEKLNKLQIRKMHYYTKLGTDLELELPYESFWTSAGGLVENSIVNMPSYEIFTSPNYHKTNGIVYSSKPLSYNGGVVEDFYLEFKDGKVKNYDAKVGKNLLKEIISSDEHSCYLGEVAIVENTSPISNTGIVFENTLLDENSSCHLALGNGFTECIINSENLSNNELCKRGINQSKVHVDFMIGTNDCAIEAETREGPMLILKNGDFNL